MTLKVLAKMNVETVPKLIDGGDHFIADISLLQSLLKVCIITGENLNGL